MTPYAAQALAGTASRLGQRPRGRVVHVVADTAPLTPSGRFPRGVRAVCRARTRQLHPVETSPLDPGARRVCARCSACLSPRSRSGQAEHSPVSRNEWIAAYGDLTVDDLAAAAVMADTVPEIERVEFLALLLVGFHGCREQLHDGQTLEHVVRRNRARVDALHRDPDDVAANAAAREARAHSLRLEAKQRAHDIWQDRQNRYQRTRA